MPPHEPIDRLNAALADRYRIERKLGQGGMAVVYLAHDLKHDRRVAIKVLRPELAAVVGAERFLSEIRTTANLQHPHILPLFDSGEADTFLFYVMPFVDGESLRDRLDRDRQLPVEDAVGIARKVASALAYAHEQGVIHRDIKPANILLHRGEPLVADFGIALAVAEAGGGRITETGLSLGTPHYMSPEQAAGERSLDPRSDVYALGCVLYEMLTGEPPHVGPSAQAVLAKILTDEARPVTRSRRVVPPNVDAAVSGALAKLPADRFASPAAFARALEDPSYRRPGAPSDEDRAGQAAALRRWKAAALALGATAVAFAVLGVTALTRPSPRPPVFRAALSLEGVSGLLTPQIGPALAISRDGSTLAYFGRAGGPQWQLWLRRADQLEAIPLPGTESAFTPVFSPDGRRLALSGPTFELKIVDLETGTVRTLTDQAVSVMDWTEDGYIHYFRGESFGNVYRIADTGGEPEAVAMLSGYEGPTPPWGFGEILPGGEAAVMTRFPPGMQRLNAASVVAVDFGGGEIRELATGVSPRYVQGHLLWGTADGTIMAARFDPESFEMGVVRQVSDGVLTAPSGVVHYDADDSGGLVYRTGAGTSQAGRLVWVDRDGEIESASSVDIALTVGLWEALGLSPDGSRVALSRADGVTSHVWVQDLVTGAPPRRISFDGTLNVRPSWGPDDGMVSWISDRAGPGLPTRLWSAPADGGRDPEPLVVSDREIEEGFVSPDGQWVVYRLGGTSTNRDVFTRALSGDTTPRAIAATAANERAISLSPDGRWLAYVSDETGRDEVFVTRFPEGTGKWQVSAGGGTSPAWSPVRPELYYVTFDGRLTAARYGVRGGSFAVEGVEPLFSVQPFVIGLNVTSYAVSPTDGRFLMIALGSAAGGEVVWVRNWISAFEGAAR